MSTVRDLGEFGLIDLLARQIAAAAERPSDLIVDLGDDAAAWRIGGLVQIATTDTLVAPWDFLPDRVDWGALGWKALAANISDIAAMGGQPRWALVTAALPPDFPIESAQQLYEGMLELAVGYGVHIVGGDIARNDTPALTVALLGEAELDAAGEPLLLRRSAGRPGDVLAVTGPLGASAGGLQLVLANRSPESEDEAELLRAHYRPEPRVDYGRALVRVGVRSGMDISDGLVADAGKLARASGCSARIHAELVPLSAPLARCFPDQALAFALSGGEDFELLIAARHDLVQRSIDAGVPLTVVGELTAGEAGRVEVVDAAGRELQLATAGWEQWESGTQA